MEGRESFQVTQTLQKLRAEKADPSTIYQLHNMHILKYIAAGAQNHASMQFY
jgi:hypothetical protein